MLRLLILSTVSLYGSFEGVYRYMEVKDYERARSLLLSEMSEKTVDGYQLLADIDSARGDWAAVKDDYKNILVLDSKNEKAHLELARVLSWQKDYEASIKAYDEMIALGLGKEVPYVEKAHVLAWDNQKQAALLAYAAAYEKFQLSWIEDERKGYEALWLNKRVEAEKHFRSSLQGNPGNEDVLFSLGQLYADFDNAEAQKTLQSLLAKNPYHSSAQEALRKLTARSSQSRLRFSFDYLDARSNQWDTQVQRSQFWALFEKQVKALFWNVKLGHSVCAYPDRVYVGDSVDVAAGYIADRFGCDASIGDQRISDGISNRYRGQLSIWYRAFDVLSLRLFGEKMNFFHNKDVVEQNINDRSVGLHSNLNLHEHVTLSALVKTGYPDDGNRYLLGDASIEVHGLWPKRLFARLGVEWQDFRKTSSYYFSPTSFSTYYLDTGIDLTFAEKNSFCYASRKWLCSLKVRTAMDSNYQTSIQPSFDTHIDLNDSWACEISASMNQSHVYRDWALSLHGIFSF